MAQKGAEHHSLGPFLNTRCFESLLNMVQEGRFLRIFISKIDEREKVLWYEGSP